MGTLARGPIGQLLAVSGVTLAAVLGACKAKNVADAEAKKDIAWLAEERSPEAVAALARLADTDPRAVTALEKRSSLDVHSYIGAWEAVTRGAAWGTPYLRSALADPTRAEVAATTLPRRDPRLVPFATDLEGAVVRLSSGQRGSVVAGVLASIGPSAHAQVERRLIDPKTRGAMCDGIGLPEASGDAKSLLLAVPAEGRDHESCINVISTMATTEQVVIDWLATGAEPGLLSAMARGTLPCGRLSAVWAKAILERAPESTAALAVPIQLAMRRCATALDTVFADVLAKAPRSRAVILNAIDPYSGDLSSMKETCTSLRAAWVRAEPPRVRARAEDALNHGCKFAF